MFFTLIALLVLGQEADTKPAPSPAKVHSVFPTIPVSTPPVTQPEAPSAPDAVPLLLPGRLYVVQSDVKFKLFPGTDGLVTIRKVKGPRDISGVFADGNGEDEDRTYDAPYLAIVKAEKGKTGQVKLIYDPKGSEEESHAITILLNIGPRPPPTPVPTPEPEPDKPPPAPQPDDAFKTLVKSITAIHPELPADEKPKIAQAFREAAKQIEEGKITEPGMQLTKATADLMIQKLGGVNGMINWVPWRDAVTKALKTQNLSSIKDHVKPWNTIADVLEARP